MNLRLKKLTIRIVIPLVILLSALVAPLFNVSVDVINSLLTVTALVFAILVGFFIAAATTNYITFQQSLAQECGNLVAMFNFTSIVDPASRDKMAEIIDQYVIATLDYSLAEFVDKTYHEFRRVVEQVDLLRPENDDARVVAALERTQELKIELFKNRESIKLAAHRVIGGFHWLVLVILAAILTFLLLTLRTDALLLNFAIGVLTASIYFTLVLLYNIDGNTFLEEQLAYKDVQIIFETIGRLPYYPSLAFSEGEIKKPSGSYRIGVYTDYPNSFAKTIRVVNPKNRS